MIPVMRPGDAVKIIFCDPRQLSVGDIVAFKTEGRVTVHRALRIKRSGTEFRVFQSGDNLGGGSWLRNEQILGRVSKVVGWDGREYIVPPASGGLRVRCFARYLHIVLPSLVRSAFRVLLFGRQGTWAREKDGQ